MHRATLFDDCALYKFSFNNVSMPFRMTGALESGQPEPPGTSKRLYMSCPSGQLESLDSLLEAVLLAQSTILRSVNAGFDVVVATDGGREVAVQINPACRVSGTVPCCWIIRT